MSMGLALRVTVLAILLMTAALRQARAEELPTEIGACSETTIEDIGYRLGDPDSGSAISYANGGGQVPATTAARSIARRISAPAIAGKLPTRSTRAAALKTKRRRCR